MDPLELVQFAEGECQDWFSANETVLNTAQTSSNIEITSHMLGKHLFSGWIMVFRISI